MSVLIDDIYTYLVAQGVVAGATGWPCYKMYWVDDDTRGVLLQIEEGAKPDTRWTIDEPILSVWVRGDEREHEAAQTKMQEIIDTLFINDAGVGSNYVYINQVGSGYTTFSIDASKRALLNKRFEIMRDG
jgi:hypothetical protein